MSLYSAGVRHGAMTLLRAGTARASDRATHNHPLVKALVLLTCLLCTMQPASAKTYGVVVTGLGGNAEYSESFAQSSQQFATGLSTLESDSSLIITLDESATRDSILEAIEQQVSRMTSDAADARCRQH